MPTTDKNEQPTIRISAARKSLLATYGQAAACLYGALSISEFTELFNHYEDERTNEQEAVLALQRYLKAHPYETEYSLYGEYITGPNLMPDEFEDDIESLEILRAEQKGKPRFLPEKDEFLKFTRADYFEPTRPYEEFKNYVLKNKLNEKEGLNGVDGDILNLLEMIQERVEIKEIIRHFAVNRYRFNGIEEINAFLKVVMNVWNNTRAYELNGHTPDEMMNIEKDNR
jgi:hypothetical protein